MAGPPDDDPMSGAGSEDDEDALMAQAVAASLEVWDRGGVGGGARPLARGPG